MTLAECEEHLRAVIARHPELSDEALASLCIRLGNEIRTGEGR